MVYIDAMRRHEYFLAALVPFLRLGVALLSLSNFSDSACTGTVPAILGAGILASLWGGWVAWTVAIEHAPAPRRQQAPLILRAPRRALVGLDAISGHEGDTVGVTLPEM